MIETLWNIFELFVNLFESAVLTHFICTFLGNDIRRKKERRNWLVVSLIYATTVTILNSLMDYEGIFCLIYIMISFLCALFFFSGSIIKKLFASVFGVSCIIFVSHTVTNFITTITQTPVTEVYGKSGGIRFVTVVLVQLFDFYLFQILLRIFGNLGTYLKRSEWSMLLIVLVISILLSIFIQLVQFTEDLSLMARAMLLAADICIICVNVVVLKIFEILNRLCQVKIENELLHTQLQYQIQYDSISCQQEETLRKQRHDFKNHMEILQELAEQEDIPEIRKYLAQYCSQSRPEYIFLHTGHAAVDAVINTKLYYAQELGIQTTCTIDSNLPKMPEIDLCTLLGNLLDNAIEASKKEQDAPEIHLAIERMDTRLFICVKNKIESSVLAKNAELRTEKNDATSHGCGIAILKEVTEKYAGSIDFFEADEFFVAQVILYV